MLESLEGDFVTFTGHGNGVLFKPKRLGDPDDVLTPAEAKKVMHALKQVRQGKTKPWPKSSMIWTCELTEDGKRNLRKIPKAIQSNAKPCTARNGRACSGSASVTTGSSS
ncbi:MAG: hypothetical protein HYX25_00075 [Candidatus Solibacter usitatus]|nr:hypothetical protein [Candidatus Solibacter usitatus]